VGFSTLFAVAMEEIDALNFLIRVQGEIKRCRELAAQSSDPMFVTVLSQITDEMERKLREMDRL
jgi:hypothetical protein